MKTYLSSLLGNVQHLDGGAMFGHVPKVVWSQWMTPDAKNRVKLACRALLIQEENKNILLETGIGGFFDPALRDRYGVEEKEHVLLQSLKKIGLSDADIDVVILSHLHFDHAGGLLAPWKERVEPQLLFPKAQYLVSKAGWERANRPHVRDRASFVPALNELLERSGRLHLIENEKSALLGDQYTFFTTQGHTPGLLHTMYRAPNQGWIIFVSDLIPGLSWIHLPVTMGYDRSAEMIIEEKRKLLALAAKQKAFLFYTHDPVFAMSHIAQDDKGKFIAVDKMETLNQVLA